MIADRRSAAAALLTLSLTWGAAVTVAGCGGSPDTVSGGKPHSHSGQAALPGIISCLNGHGMTVPAAATRKQVESAVQALPETRRQSVFNACSPLMPAKFRQKFWQGRTKPAPATSAS